MRKDEGRTQHQAVRIDFIPVEGYISRPYVQLEAERLWARVWQMACREEEIPNPGDFYTYDIADQSITVVRRQDGAIAAYHNVCPHRGRRLTTGCGRMGRFHCKYHGWQWSLEGTPTHIVDRHDWNDLLSDADVSLVPVMVGTWGGWIFVNMDSDCEPLESFLEPAKSMLDPYEFDKMRYRWRRQVILPCNWKVAQEAFDEGYHVQTTHRQLLAAQDDRSYSKAYGKHGMFGYDAARVRGVPSRRIADEETRRTVSVRDGFSWFVRNIWETLDATVTTAMVRAADRVKNELPVDAPGAEVLAAFARFHREETTADGTPWPDISVEQIIAAGTDWHIFPNMVFLQQPTNLLGYRARPNGDDPDSCIFEVYVLERFAPGKEPKDVQVEIAADWRTADWGLILSQDFQNMGEVQRGMKSRAFKGARPNPLQERAISNFHEALHYYLTAKN
ncbi:aromatic ring-hydroxylating dioxygenase subunit alpha [Sphingobium sp.]|uniref:aromatic ring-hydroxylating oxygenase subunit alpha n=1 Tax=Sphingobium sp. TaxID=1912891 RepID=UPI0028BD1A27|nr:aromatic ring-hydroxylating dioxygenase subunit alpha [Sphingobium sp.]